MEPTKISSQTNGISAGVWVDLEAAWLLGRLHVAHSQLLLASALGVSLVVIAVAAL